MAEKNNILEIIDEKELADFFKAMCHPTRIKILKTIYENDLCVNDISDQLNLNQPNTSQHLAIMKDKNILKKIKKGNEVCYKIKDLGIIRLIKEASNLIKKLNES